ncbi:4-(cytidine 5'-diphospho)-2-C-methyl-D-erythritol kinase [Agromyces atrinae]|uniref:4-diphosphocytidyl-2-C-methyl-D-erythritol kinase n=1 Tax=Agromyces atrinae TaxID=592376 RepID=A0A4Q2M7F6_9MICO|nr:4-(cytidine 5'-diphospho)-2-C-methyl-D-erythritol kinase [Agromyces atrinae]MCI2959367.1 4-(cytidine 5'-diphospho)-2-C-methyl-D-erythritol kinase [Agromyces atrinae]NYD68783.1 4-diphosphocytidyl-2-C-methyl-D-erythritol kinase [Agromyces atrinae]RXZ85080.1 4-(cytidine 5'-diphospho)-2-C-methyl-D-erythritol kinase [Agromyces atrinae]RXZ85839.1 4-(cytidine 5'-diphospho)-2-C-methyl-D-erythritol kinase [Agromyces atrinae]
MTFAQTVPSVRVRAPGKINLFMKVGALHDDGYHDVATAYQAVSLYEEVTAYPSETFSVEFSGSIDTSALPADRTNLAIRAAKMLARKAGIPTGVRLEIQKNVPIAGGMGGGSADAAATLVACDALWGTEFAKDELLALAAKLGADVPFSLMGGTAIGTGRGDRLSPALATGDFHWVLAIAEFGMSTPLVYGELDRHRELHANELAVPTSSPSVDTAVLQALRAGDARLLADSLHNDLQAATLHLAPGLGAILELGEKHGALAGIVSGSGPTLAFLAADADAALELQVALSAARLTALRVHGPVHGARVIH